MKGFEIRHNGKVIFAAIENGLFTMYTSHLKGEVSNLYVGGVDYEKQSKVVWYDKVPIKIGDMIEIKYTEIDHISEPVKCIHDEGMKRPFSKLEMFFILEQYLKSRGLL